MMKHASILCVLALVWTGCGGERGKVLMCYWGTWSVYRQGEGGYSVEHMGVPAAACSHLVYTFVGLNDDGTVRILDPYLDLPDNWGRDNFGKMNRLKESHPGLKTLLAVGGWNELSAKYSRMAHDPSLRAAFVRSATDLVLQHGFDGLDFDWEYPNRRDSVYGEADINNFSQLLRELREEFDKFDLVLTAAVSSVRVAAELSYDIPAITKSLDLISLMTYDMHGAWDDVTGHNAPLYKATGDEEVAEEDAFTVDAAVKYWLQQGCPAEKLLVGVPLYGRSFRLADPARAGLRAPTTGAGLAGPYTATPGTIGYNELCVRLQTEDWDVHYDELGRVPYAVRNRDWVSYDDEDSVRLKAEYAVQLGLAGVMVWSIETEDFHGLCHVNNYTLIRTVANALGREIDGDDHSSASGATSESTFTTSDSTFTTSDSTFTTSDSPFTTSDSTFTTSDSNTTTNSTTLSTTTSYESTTTVGTTTTDGSVDHEREVCREEGFSQDPLDCSVFYRCVRDSDGRLSAVRFSCPASLLWDASLSVCNYADLVDCHSHSP